MKLVVFMSVVKKVNHRNTEQTDQKAQVDAQHRSSGNYPRPTPPPSPPPPPPLLPPPPPPPLILEDAVLKSKRLTPRISGCGFTGWGCFAECDLL